MLSFYNKEETLTKESLVYMKHMEILKNVVSDVVDCYFKFLCNIASEHFKDSTDKDLNKNKFAELRQDLFDFVKQHENFISIGHYTIKVDSEDFLQFSFDSFSSADDFVSFNSLKMFCLVKDEISSVNLTVEGFTNFHLKPCGYVVLLERIFKRPFADITIEQTLNFQNVPFLVYQKLNRSKCSYAGLKENITRRTRDFMEKIVSAERIEELSFKLNKKIKKTIAEKQCSICQQMFRVRQKLCRMPCNHFFHKSCIQKWLKAPSSKFITKEVERLPPFSTLVAKNTDYNEQGLCLPNPFAFDYVYGQQELPNFKKSDYAEECMDVGNTDNSLVFCSKYAKSESSSSDDSESTNSEKSETSSSDESETNDSYSLVSSDELNLSSSEDFEIPASDSPTSSIYESESGHSVDENDVVDRSYDGSDYELPEYDIEEDVPETAKFQCPNCRHICC